MNPANTQIFIGAVNQSVDLAGLIKLVDAAYNKKLVAATGSAEKSALVQKKYATLRYIKANAAQIKQRLSEDTNMNAESNAELEQLMASLNAYLKKNPAGEFDDEHDAMTGETSLSNATNNTRKLDMDPDNDGDEEYPDLDKRKTWQYGFSREQRYREFPRTRPVFSTFYDIPHEMIKEAMEQKNYHSVFVHDKKTDRWSHHTDADNAEDARLERQSLRNQGMKTKSFVVAKGSADWRKNSPHDFVMDKMKKEGKMNENAALYEGMKAVRGGY